MLTFTDDLVQGLQDLSQKLLAFVCNLRSTYDRAHHLRFDFCRNYGNILEIYIYICIECIRMLTFFRVFFHARNAMEWAEG